MSGKIKVKVRLGKSKNSRYSYYPEWYLEVEGEDGIKTTLSPTFEEMIMAIRDILIHERKVDMTRERKPDFERWKQKLLQTIKEVESMKIDLRFDDYIYLQQKKLKNQ
jgi:hypothetical protein